MTEETDADDYTTLTTHLRNGLEQSITRPDGSTVKTLYFLNGKINQRTGTGMTREYYSYTISGQKNTSRIFARGLGAMASMQLGSRWSDRRLGVF